MSWCRLGPGGILTCRKCIKAMRLPRWNGVLWGFSAGLLRCNTRPWHCFLGWHPKSECIISNFCPSMATTDGTPSISQLWCLLTIFNIFSQRKTAKKNCCKSSTNYYTFGRKVRVGFKMPVSSCLTKMSWCRLGGIPTCRKCIKAMRLPRWNGVLWGFSAGLLRCNTRPWHCFLGWHPKSECIISNFCPSMATTNGTPSISQLRCLLTFLSIFSQRKNKERTCCSVRAINHPTLHTRIGGKWGLGFSFLFHPVGLKCSDVNQHQSNEAPTMEWCSLRVLCWPLAMQHPALALLSRVAP